MGLFRKRKSRATRRAEARAIKARAKLEAKLAAKNEARRLRDDRKAADKVLKAQIKSHRDSDRTALKVAEAELKAAREGKLLSPTRIRRVLTVSRLLAPILTPVIYRAAMAARALIDQRRADQLGIPLAQIGQFSGHGAQLSARIAGAEKSLRMVQERSPRTPRPSSSWPPSPSGSVICRRPSPPRRTCRPPAGARRTRRSHRNSTVSKPI